MSLMCCGLLIKNTGGPSKLLSIFCSNLFPLNVLPLNLFKKVMIGIEHDEIVYVPFSKAIKNDKPIKRDLVNVLKELSI